MFENVFSKFVALAESLLESYETEFNSSSTIVDSSDVQTMFKTIQWAIFKSFATVQGNATDLCVDAQPYTIPIQCTSNVHQKCFLETRLML